MPMHVTDNELTGMPFRKMREKDRAAVTEMMRKFYASDAVHSNGSEEIFADDITACVSDNPYLEGFVFLKGDNAAGYAMLAHSFSTEYGKMCIWIEDIYLSEEARSLGLASAFLDFVEAMYPDALHRLEAERENIHAMEVYRRKGFTEMPYVELYR